MAILEKVKIVDFSRLLPGPFCTMLLGDMGADIIKVEEKGRGDYTREMLPGAYYSSNRNKRSIAINLKTEEGKALAVGMAAKCDVLVEGFRPGVAERLGIDYHSVRKANPAIIYCSISGYGQSGPYKDHPGHDVNYLSIAGAMSIPGQAGKPPARGGLPVGDLAASMYAAISIMAALYFKRETGKGQYIDISIADCVYSWASTRFDYHAPGAGNGNGGYKLRATNDIFDTSDGKKIALGVIEEKYWVNLCRSIARPDLLADARFASDNDRCKNNLTLRQIMYGIFIANTREFWLDALRKGNVPATPVYSTEETLADPHLNARDMIKKVMLTSDGREIVQVPFPAKFSGASCDIRMPPPELGEHTNEILAKELGVALEKVNELRESGVIE